MNRILKKITAVTIAATFITGGVFSPAVTALVTRTNAASASDSADDVVVVGSARYSKDMKKLISVAPETEGTFTIASTATKIDQDAFKNCTSLKEIVIPQGLTEMGGELYETSIFSDCTSLEKITVNKNNTAYTSADGVMYNKSKTEVVYAAPALTGDLTLPESLSAIDSFAFFNCTNLRNIVIPEGTKVIGKSAFRGCTKLMTAVIPDSVEILEDKYVFSGCRNLLIYSNPGSAAEKFAKDNNITWRDASIPFKVDISFKSHEHTVGMAVHFDYVAKGGTGNYSYHFHYRKPGDSKIYFPNYNTFIPETTGEYTLVYWAKCNTEVIQDEIPIIVKPAAALTNKSTISSKGIGVGQSIKLHAEGTGGKGEHYYAMMYKKQSDSKWTQLVTKYTMITDTTFTPSEKGVYDIMINVKDEEGTVKSKKFTLTVSAHPLENRSSISADTIPAETKVTLNAAAYGGTGKYQYAIMYKKHTSSTWTQLVPKYGTESHASFKPGKVGTYDIMINVKDSAGTVVSKKFTLRTTEPLVNKSYVSATTVSAGKIISAYAVAAGGTGSYTYAIMYKKSGTDTWTQLAPKYGTMSTIGFTIKTAGSYDMLINVKDSSGKVKSKSFTIKVV